MNINALQFDQQRDDIYIYIYLIFHYYIVFQIEKNLRKTITKVVKNYFKWELKRIGTIN